MFHFCMVLLIILSRFAYVDLNISKEAKELSKLKYGHVELIEWG